MGAQPLKQGSPLHSELGRGLVDGQHCGHAAPLILASFACSHSRVLSTASILCM